MMVQPHQVHNYGKYDNNGKGLYFQFDDDNKMSNKYILLITKTIYAIKSAKPCWVLPKNLKKINAVKPEMRLQCHKSLFPMVQLVGSYNFLQQTGDKLLSEPAIV